MCTVYVYPCAKCQCLYETKKSKCVYNGMYYWYTAKYLVIAQKEQLVDKWQKVVYTRCVGFTQGKFTRGRIKMYCTRCGEKTERRDKEYSLDYFLLLCTLLALLATVGILGGGLLILAMCYI